MEEERFTAEALALEVVGLFEHPQTTSVRMESAIAKMLVSELLHGMIERTEDIYGLEGQTCLHLVEKRKRDARILNIYEGTNEIQRFLILKDLATEFAVGHVSNVPSQLPNYLGPEALELEALKAEVRQRITAALEAFGQELWQNPNLQANCFLLAEAAAWLKAADSTLGRLSWIERHIHADDNAEPPPKLDLGRRALLHCSAEARNRLSRFDEELAHLRRGYYAPEVHAASLLFGQDAPFWPHASSVRPLAPSQITSPLAILVVVEPSAAMAPHLHVSDGRLLEPHLALNDSDRSALETALRLREQAGDAVAITVVTAGPRGWADVLREALSLGVDRVRLALCADAFAPDDAAGALAALLGDKAAFDLVLGGDGDAGTEEGLLARLTAEALGIPHAGRASQLTVQKTQGEAEVLLLDANNQQRTRPLPAAVAIEAGLPLRPFTTAGYLAGLAKTVEIERWPRKAPVRSILLEPGFQEGGGRMLETCATERPQPLTPLDAARLTRDQIGLGSVSIADAASFNGIIEDVPFPTSFDGGIVVVLLADARGRFQPAAQGALLAARLLAACERIGLTVLLLTPRSEEAQRHALARIQESMSGSVILLTAGGADESADVKGRVLKEAWSYLVTTPRAVVGEPWTEEAFAALSRRGRRRGVAALRIRRVVVEEGGIALESFRARGQIRVRQTITDEPGLSYWISLAAEVEVLGEPTPPTKTVPRIERWSPRLERFYGRGDVQRLLHELKQETGLARLADADFIIDVGFGVGSRDGYEWVIEPLERALRELGVRSLVVGGSRKVTEELRLLPADRQIGQSGVSVNPRVLVAIGVSGAPQHLHYIGTRATILAFNRDPEAPIMTLNQRQSRPRVFPILGDLFETIPAFTAALRQETPPETEADEPAAVASGSV
jgi:electron transfer flavoprotein alpha subunit